MTLARPLTMPAVREVTIVSEKAATTLRTAIMIYARNMDLCSMNGKWDYSGQHYCIIFVSCACQGSSSRHICAPTLKKFDRDWF